MLYRSIFTLYLACFLHCFEPVQCRSTRHLNEYNNPSSLTRRCLRSCFLVRDFSFDLKVLKNSVLLTVISAVRRTAKYSGGINILTVCNEVFPVRISDDGRSIEVVVENCSLQQIQA